MYVPKEAFKPFFYGIVLCSIPDVVCFYLSSMCTIYPHRCFPIYIHCRFCAILPLNQSLMPFTYGKAPATHDPIYIYIYIFNMILVDSMGSVQTSIDFRRATDSFKTYAKGYDTLLDSNATFPFRWHILKPSSPKYVNPTKSQKT